MLTYQAKQFDWMPHHKTVPDVPDVTEGGQCRECVVVWLHVENDDQKEPVRVIRQTLKHIKWIANKRSMKAIVLHSFAHLGGETAPAGFAMETMTKLAERLTATGYVVQITPFGYFCSWSLDVYGDSLAKVYKAIEAR